MRELDMNTWFIKSICARWVKISFTTVIHASYETHYYYVTVCKKKKTTCRDGLQIRLVKFHELI
jgi:hypothetical protein